MVVVGGGGGWLYACLGIINFSGAEGTLFHSFVAPGL